MEIGNFIVRSLYIVLQIKFGKEIDKSIFLSTNYVLYFNKKQFVEK